MSQQSRTTASWQALDAAHHVHPFTDPKPGKGVRVITRGEGVYIWDSDGNRSSTAWRGSGASMSATAARNWSMRPLRNSDAAVLQQFWQTSTPSQIELVRLLASVCPAGIRTFFFANSGSEANDTVVRLVRHYWDVAGKPTQAHVHRPHAGLSRQHARRDEPRRHGAHAQARQVAAARVRAHRAPALLHAGRRADARAVRRRGRAPSRREDSRARRGQRRRLHRRADPGRGRRLSTRRRATGRRSSGSAASTMCCSSPTK